MDNENSLERNSGLAPDETAAALEIEAAEENVEALAAQEEAAYEAPAAVPPVPETKESRRERKAREKEEARLEKERAKQKAKEEKAAARAAKRAEIKYRNIPTVIILSLILALFVAGLGYLGWEYIGARAAIDKISDEKTKLEAQLEDLGKTIEDKEAQISEQLSQIENKNALISDSDAAVKEISEKVSSLEDQVKTVRTEAADLLDVISDKHPLGVAFSGDFFADRAVVLINDGESFPLNIFVMYGEKKTDISYSFDESTKNIDTLSLSQETITGSSGLISVKAKKKTADESALAVLKFENDLSEDFFYVIVIVK